MDSLELVENFIVERKEDIDLATRQDLEVTLTDELKDTRAAFGEAMKKLIAEVPGDQKYLEMVQVQVKLARTLWCFDQLSGSLEEPDLDVSHREEMEKAVRELIFDTNNPDSWVNVRGSKNAEKCSQELYGVISTLAFLNLMQEVDPDYASGAIPAQLFSSPNQDVHDKVDMVIKKNGTALLLQLKSGDRVQIDSIPFEENGSYNSTPLVNRDEMQKMRRLGRNILRDDRETSKITIAAVRVPSLVNGQIRSVDVFGRIRNERLIAEFKAEAKVAGLVASV